MELALRIDVDTHDGLRDGVPRLLELLRRLGLRASFFVAFGPERAGLAAGRLWDPTFAWKLLRTRALGTYGWRAALSGTLLPARPVGEAFAPFLRDVAAEGHEVGLHGYDHFGWQRRIHRMRRAAVDAAFRAGIDAFSQALGRPPAATAAPGWRTTAAALTAQEQLGFTYASDCRGTSPFRLRVGGTAYATPQIPTTLPTMDELMGTVRDLPGALEAELRPGLNVFTAHAEIEGGRLAGEFERFLGRVLARRVRLRRLEDVAEPLRARDGVPWARVRRGRVRGRSGWVLVQDGPAGGEQSG